MPLWLTFVQNDLPTILSAVLTAIVGFLGLQLKKLFDRILSDEVKQKTAKTCVAAVEQLYQDLDGEQKKQKAVEGITQMLQSRGLTVSQLEMDMLIEAAVAALKNGLQA